MAISIDDMFYYFKHIVVQKTESWVRPPGSHPVTLAERDHLLSFKQSQTEVPFAGGRCCDVRRPTPNVPIRETARCDDGCCHRIGVYRNVRL